MRTIADAVSYTEIRSKLDTFDLVLWSSGDKLARLIQVGTNSIWTHVGMVVRFPGDVLMLWESTFDDTTSGVRLSPLSKALCDSVSVRLATVERTQTLWNRLMDVRKDLDGRPFENNVLEFICAAYDGPFGLNKRNVTALFCSELIAETLQRVGLLADDKPSNEFTPNDFSTTASNKLNLIGLTYGDEVSINYTMTNQSIKPFNRAKLPLCAV